MVAHLFPPDNDLQVFLNCSIDNLNVIEWISSRGGEQADNQGVIHQETEDFKIITQCPYYEKLPSYTTVGRYEVVIDYSALYICFDVVEKHVEVYPFADLVIDSDWFYE